MENLTDDQANTQGQQPNSIQLTPQNNWWRIGFFVTVALFLATAGVFGFYIFRIRKEGEFPQPTQVPVPAPTLTQAPTPTPIPEVSPTPAPEPTVGWKTYTNTKYGYEIKYPPEIKMYEGGTETVFQFLGPRAQVPGEFTDGFGITIRVIENKENKTPRQLAEDSLKESQENIAIVGGDITKCRIEEAKRGDLEGARFIHCLRMPGSGILEFCEWFIHKGNTIETHANLQNESYRDLFNLMLSAFKFLPSTSPGQGE